MKLFVKMLTLASIVMAGTAASASVSESYQNYSNGKRNALDSLERSCEKNCNRLACLNGETAESCAKNCPFHTIRNCLSAGLDIKSEDDFGDYLAASGMGTDANGVPVPSRRRKISPRGSTRGSMRRSARPVMGENARRGSLRGSTRSSRSFSGDRGQEEDGFGSRRASLSPGTRGSVSHSRSAYAVESTSRRLRPHSTASRSRERTRSASSRVPSSRNSRTVEGRLDGSGACVCKLVGIPPATPSSGSVLQDGKTPVAPPTASDAAAKAAEAAKAAAEAAKAPAPPTPSGGRGKRAAAS